MCTRRCFALFGWLWLQQQPAWEQAATLTAPLTAGEQQLVSTSSTNGTSTAGCLRLPWAAAAANDQQAGVKSSRQCSQVSAVGLRHRRRSEH
jgi:hypothetical protein